MENASKALIMAASVLLGVMIISFAVYLFSTFGSYSSSYIATFGSKVLALSMIFASVMVTGMRLFDAITAVSYTHLLEVMKKMTIRKSIMATLSCWQIFMGCPSIISFAGQRTYSLYHCFFLITMIFAGVRINHNFYVVSLSKMIFAGS